HDESFGVRIKRLCNQQFTGFRSVSVRCVDQVHTKLDGASHNFERILAIWRPTPNPLTCETHGTESKSIDRQIATQTEDGVVACVRCHQRRSPKNGGRSSRQKRGAARDSCTKKQPSAYHARKSLIVSSQRFVVHSTQPKFTWN